MKSTSKIFILLLIFVLSGYKIAFCDIYVYEDNTGKRHFSPAPLNSEYKLYLKSKNIKIDKKLKESTEKSAKKRAERISENSKWSKEDKDLILNHYVRLGMDMDQCKESWGKPMQASSTTTYMGKTTHWCYGDFCLKALVFENGLLVLIRE